LFAVNQLLIYSYTIYTQHKVVATWSVKIYVHWMVAWDLSALPCEWTLWHTVDLQTFVTYYRSDAHTLLCPVLVEAVTEKSTLVYLSDCHSAHTDMFQNEWVTLYTLKNSLVWYTEPWRSRTFLHTCLIYSEIL